MLVAPPLGVFQLAPHTALPTKGARSSPHPQAPVGAAQAGPTHQRYGTGTMSPLPRDRPATFGAHPHRPRASHRSHAALRPRPGEAYPGVGAGARPLPAQAPARV